MRGHSVDKNKISETAKIYETRKVDNTINNAITTLLIVEVLHLKNFKY